VVVALAPTIFAWHLISNFLCAKPNLPFFDTGFHDDNDSNAHDTTLL
jgi:hypothetical protein